MQTIKTAVVVVLLMGVCYGAYVALNAPEPVLPPELEAWSSENGDLGPDFENGSIDIPQLSEASSADLNALLPPNLTAVDASAGASKANQSAPALPKLDIPDLDSSRLGSDQTSSAETSDLGLPPELEGSSVPLPSAGGTPGTMVSVSKQPESSSVALPGFPGLDASDTKAGTPTAPPLGSFSAGGSADSSLPNAAAAAKAQSAKPLPAFKTAREEALKLAGEGKLREALAKMSPYYNHIDLTRDEQLDLIDMLDALAAEVIYSKRHLLEPPFIFAAGDTLESVANKFRISPEALARINMMGDSKVVLTGAQLKVLNGPMRADVNLTRGELTLFLNDLYAGRFPVSVGKEPAPVEGTFAIIDRRRDRTYYGANSQVLPASDGRNPYGGYWMGLPQDMCIHGSPATTSPELSNAGCISLAPLDAREVYSLLSQGSQVTIHR